LIGPIAAASASIGLYVILNFIYAVGSFPVGVLADRHNKAILLGMGYLFNAMACLLLALWTGNILVLGLAFIAVGLQLALTDTAESALAAELLPRDIVGTGYGVLQLVDGVGDFSSSFIVGVIWVVLSPQIGLLYSMVLSVVATLLIVILLGKNTGQAIPKNEGAQTGN
jgi:MFS family permease